jgi:hypothetical protein
MQFPMMSNHPYNPEHHFQVQVLPEDDHFQQAKQGTSSRGMTAPRINAFSPSNSALFGPLINMSAGGENSLIRVELTLVRTQHCLAQNKSHDLSLNPR